MGIKKTLTSIVLSAAAVLSSLGCFDKNKDFGLPQESNPPIVAEPDPEPNAQLVSAEFQSASDSGKYAFLSVNNTTFSDSYLFCSDAGTLRNISNNPVGIFDSIGIFVGESPISIVCDSTRKEDNDQCIKIYDEQGNNVIFQSDYFVAFLNLLSYKNQSNCARAIFEGFKETGGTYNTNLFVYSAEKNEAAMLFPQSQDSSIKKMSDDGTVMFFSATDLNGETALYLFKASDESLTHIINMPGQFVDCISKNNSIAFVKYNAEGGYGLRIVDLLSPGIRLLNLPSGKKFRSVQALSENGCSALLALEDIVNHAEEIVHLDTHSNETSLITPASVSYRKFTASGMSPDGAFSAFTESELNRMYIYNFSAKSFYDTLPLATRLNDSFLIGFSSNNKMLFYCTDSCHAGHLLMHDLISRTNTILLSNYSSWREPALPSNDDWFYIMSGESNEPTNTSLFNKYGLWGNLKMNSDMQRLIANARDSSSGRYGVLLLNLSNLNEDFISRDGLDASFLDISPDLNYLLIQCRNGSGLQNISVYSMQHKELRSVLDYEDTSVGWIDVLGHSKNSAKLYFKENFTDGSKRIKEYCYASGKVRTISN